MEERCDHCEHFYLHGFYPWCSQLHAGLRDYEPCGRFKAREAALTPHPDTLRLEKLAKRAEWASRECSGESCLYELNLPHAVRGYIHPKSNTLHIDDLRAYIDNLEG